MKRSEYAIFSHVEIPQYSIHIIGIEESEQVPRLTGCVTACYKSFVPDTLPADR